MRRMKPLLIAAAALLAVTPARTHGQWLEARAKHYIVFYRSGSEKDVVFTRKWLDHAEQLQHLT